MEKDFSTVSPSAVGLLLLKTFADIPFARQAAEYMFVQDAINQTAEKLQTSNAAAWRLLHFESRYKTLSEALERLNITNIIEISSGFSFRGLEMTCKDENVYYVDTDLPGIMSTKTAVLNNLVQPLPANFSIAPLNVLDEKAFTAIASGLPPGPLAIVNEGLLVYLNLEEKQQLCSIIAGILRERGGYWVTGDIYVRQRVKVEYDENTKKFLDAHSVEENKFENYLDAEKFFTSCGFIIKGRTIRPLQKPNAWQYLNSANWQPDQNNTTATYGKLGCLGLTDWFEHL